jgi:S-adenosylmethionine hydrolase
MSPIVTLLTDFGTSDAYVGIMKGVLIGACRTATVIDLTHGIPAQNILAGALTLRSAVDAFPPGTIHVAIVDPGVGTARRAVAVATPHAIFVGPDNGLLALAAKHLGVTAVHAIENPSLFRHPVSMTFHGRDVFAPVAGALAAGVPLDAVGPRTDQLVELAIPEPTITKDRIAGRVIHVDHFGNLVTNIDPATIIGTSLLRSVVTLKGHQLRGVQATYGSVAPGQAVAVIGSWGCVEIAICGGNAANALGAGVGDAVTIEVA